MESHDNVTSSWYGWMRWVEENGEDSYGEEKNCGYTIVDIRERQNILVQAQGC